jgi:hypothetical protein
MVPEKLYEQRIKGFFEECVILANIILAGL